MLLLQYHKTGIIAVMILAVSFISGCEPSTNIVRNTPPSPSKQISPPQSIIASKNSDIFKIDDHQPPRHKINIGIMLPLSGETSTVGQALLNAATLALFDAQDRRLEIIPVDTKGNPETTREAMAILIEQKVDIIIGPLFSENIKAAQPLAKAANIKMIGFSTDHDVAGDGVYLLSFRPEEQVSRIIKYASSQRYNKFAALIPDNLYGGRIMNVLEPLVSSQFNELVALEVYPYDPSSLDEPVKKIANYNFRRKEFLDEMKFLRSLGQNDDMGQDFIDEIKNLETLGDVNFNAILLPEGGSMLGALAPLLSYYEIDLNKVKVLGTGLWHDNMLFNEPQLQGGWFAAPEDDVANQFIKRYRQAFSKQPPRLVTLGYDAMAFVANIVRYQRVPNFADQIITDPNGFNGLDGIFRFHKTGLVERGLAVYEVTNKEFKKIDDAPIDFTPPVRPLYVEIPLDFMSEFDPIFGLKGDVPALSDEQDQNVPHRQTLEISKNPSGLYP